jgi:NAD(P)-dependent dehydrogenase (short-subunit alcohol dehydrogenase family)
VAGTPLARKGDHDIFQTRFTLSGPERPLDQQVIVITGGSSGIGLCTAQLAAQRTASLVVVARGGELLRRLAGDISAQGGRTIIAGADVAVRAKRTARPCSRWATTGASTLG